MQIVVSAPREVNAVSNLSQANINDLILFVINEMGAEVTGSISSNWNINSNTLEANIDSGSFRGDDAIDIEMIIYMNDQGDLTSLYAEAMLVPGNVSIRANIVPADVSDTKKQVIKKAYYAVDVLDKVESATTNDEIAFFMLQALGYDQIISPSNVWDNENLEMSIGFSDALLNGKAITDAQFIVSMGVGNNISSFVGNFTESGALINYSLNQLDVADKFIYKVASYAMHDLYDLERAADHTSFLTNNVSFNLYRDNGDINQDVSIDNGELYIDKSCDFDVIKIATDNAYTQGINISDAIDVLRHIVGLEAFADGSAGYHAADVNNDGNINISDAISILRHIVSLETIDDFELIDDSGDRVTWLDSGDLDSASVWTIVANGDVNFSGGFAEDYLVQNDLL